jgi:hypothetical protein
VRAAAAVIGLLSALVVLALAAGEGPHGPAATVNSPTRALRGTIWWVDAGCRIEQLRLPAATRVRGPSRHCHVWPSPAGTEALVSEDDPQAPRPPGDLELIDGRSLRTLSVIGYRSDSVVSSVAWSPDGSRVSFCVARGQARTTVTIVPPSQLVQRGRCLPAWGAGSEPITSDGRHVYTESGVVRIRGRLGLLVGRDPRAYRITALTSAPLGFVLVVAGIPKAGRPARTVLATVGAGDRVVRIDPVAGGPVDAVGVSPVGRWLWYRHAFGDSETLVPLNAVRRPESVPESARGYAWSPDGSRIAVALPGELRIVDLRTGRSISLHDVDPRSVAWTR